ncbi:3-dehydroquinate synthase [Chloroflexi bacterium]|nr:3-dehydroquinate synthase [Chloroflexota bacterium]
METISYDDLASEVVTDSSTYPVWVGWGIIDQVGPRVKSELKIQTVYVISDEGVNGHARRVQASLESVGIPAYLFFVPSGEHHKNLDTVRHIYSWLADHKAERGHMIIAVGGGVIGDLAGFVAATYLRGMPFAQIPTTLLAMMDASIGGKVAVDMDQGKNLVGSFYQPKFVLSDVETLGTLPARELTSGWAEAIKHGLILDNTLLNLFEEKHNEIISLDPEIATDIIRKSVAIKAQIVSKDEKETLGVRILLNYGHTVGHAIESTTGYSKYLHGEAVSIGMMAAASLSKSMGMMSGLEVERQETLLKKYNLPTTSDDIDTDKIIEAIKSDKKTVGGSVNWVLLETIGKAVTNNKVPEHFLIKALSQLRK